MIRPSSSFFIDESRSRGMPLPAAPQLGDAGSFGMALPPPPLFLGFSGGLGCGFGTGGSLDAEQGSSTQVLVKNTFLHVSDVQKPMTRSRSDSDVSGGSSPSVSFWSHSDSSNNSSSSGKDVSGYRSRDRFDRAPGGSNVVDTRAANSAHPFAPAGLLPLTTLWSPQEAFHPTPGGSSSTDARGAVHVQFHAQTAHLPAPEGEDDPSDIASEEEDLDVPDEGYIDQHDGTLVWSVGSDRHSAGQCKPCLYFRQKNGCRNGQDCTFCHLSHQRKARARPCKAKRLRCKQMADMYDSLRTDHAMPMADLLRMGLQAQVGTSPPERSYLLKVMAGKAETQERSGGRRQVLTCSTTLQEDVQRQSDNLWKMRL